MKKTLTILLVFCAHFATAQEAPIITESKIDTVLPMFNGGEKALLKFLKNNFNTPHNEEHNGRIVVKLIVDENGNVENVEVKKSLCPETDKEAIRVAKLMKFTPATANGKNIKHSFFIPIAIHN